MAELCVVTYDQINNESKELDSQCYKRGDIVTIQPDGWKWGVNESSGMFTIVKMPGVPPEDLSYLCNEDMVPSKDGIHRELVRRRAVKFDLDQHIAKEQVDGKTITYDPVTIATVVIVKPLVAVATVDEVIL